MVFIYRETKREVLSSQMLGAQDLSMLSAIIRLCCEKIGLSDSSAGMAKCLLMLQAFKRAICAMSLSNDAIGIGKQRHLTAIDSAYMLLHLLCDFNFCEAMDRKIIMPKFSLTSKQKSIDSFDLIIGKVLKDSVGIDGDKHADADALKLFKNENILNHLDSDSDDSETQKLIDMLFDDLIRFLQ